MSVMRQDLVTWLKEECLRTGNDLLYTYLSVGSIGTTLERAILRPLSTEQLEAPITEVANLIEELRNNDQITDAEHDNLRTHLSNISLSLPPLLRWGMSAAEIRAHLERAVSETENLTDKVRRLMFEKVVECQCGKPGEVESTERSELMSKWYNKGVEAGKTDTWMDMENTIKETAEKHPEIKDARYLVGEDFDSWEETDHFQIKYGSEMTKDAKGDIVLFDDLNSRFWNGYIDGKKEIGIDIYGIAGELVKGR